MELSADLLSATPQVNAFWSTNSCQTVMSGRTGLKLVARALKANTSRREIVLLPAYLCPSLIQPFREEGFSVEFFRINEDLTIDLDDLLQLVETLHPTAVLFINYFGFPVSQEAKETFRGIKERCWVIEDCAQGSLVEQNDPVVGQIGDFIVTSFRKYLPMPDGGLLINLTQIPMPSLPPSDGRFVRYRLIGKLLRYEFLECKQDHPALEGAYLDLLESAESGLDTEIPLHAMSQISEKLLGALDLSSAMQRRRRNYFFLLSSFTEDPRLQSMGTPQLTELPRGVSPLVFAIKVATELRDQLRQELIARRVFCPIHWILPAEIKNDRFPGATVLSKRIIGLPIDQRYDQKDMESLLDRLLLAWEAIT